MRKPLPTIASGDTRICDFLKSLERAFGPASKAKEVRMYFYGVTQSGWAKIRPAVRSWLKADPTRTICAYVGTDHALTEPEALLQMKRDSVKTFVLTSYSGIYHPKLLIFEDQTTLLVLSGSNNLTATGLALNVEFATEIRISKKSPAVARWESEIHRSSSELTNALISKYRSERDKREVQLKRSGISWQFTWNERKKPISVAGGKGAQRRIGTVKYPIPLAPGVLIYEIMPKETGTAGSQIQILKEVATAYFGLSDMVGATVSLTLANQESGESRPLTMTYNENSTFRLSIHEAAFPARPCFLLFLREAKRRFSFIVISESERPGQYASLDRRLKFRSSGKRRFEIIS